MESRKMVLINVFSGLQWRHRHREQTCGLGGGGKEGECGTELAEKHHFERGALNS